MSHWGARGGGGAPTRASRVRKAAEWVTSSASSEGGASGNSITRPMGRRGGRASERRDLGEGPKSSRHWVWMWLLRTKGRGRGTRCDARGGQPSPHPPGAINRLTWGTAWFCRDVVCRRRGGGTTGYTVISRRKERPQTVGRGKARMRTTKGGGGMDPHPPEPDVGTPAALPHGQGTATGAPFEFGRSVERGMALTPG